MNEGRKILNKTKQTTDCTQECIPVGCLPPASVAVSGGVYPVGLTRGCLPRGLPREGVCPVGVCHTPCGQRDACENITFP